MKPLRALIIDDELFAREELAQLLEETGQVTVVGKASHAIEGLKLLNQLKPDVAFLDIQMPQITGIELLTMLDPEHRPHIVFVTAYDQYAIQAFEDNAFDYLLKPVDPCRLNKTIQRLEKHGTVQTEIDKIAPAQLEQIPCSGHNRIVIIASHDVEFAYSDLSGVHIQTATQKATSQLTLKVIEDKTPLIRCHRQFLVNIKAIKEIKLLDNGLAEIITLSGHPIPVSRRYLKALKETLGFH
ncbi:two-component system response regulator BtsR [Vibrio hippocampi]|nr:two-component system response regulator BtsR [Vibrio hippocampi]